MQWACPDLLKAHVADVLAGEYEIALQFDKGVIIDIGANVGAFAVWAAQRWPGATIFSYEPSREMFEFLKTNTSVFADRIHLHNYAVGDVSHTHLYRGLNNPGEASFFQLGEQVADFEVVVTKGPEVLPTNAKILKIDTEGCELEILQPLIAAGNEYSAILCEYHRESDRREIDRLLKDYVLAGSRANRPMRGVVKYGHRSLFTACG